MKKFIYWFLQLTYGLILTLPGLILLLCLKLFRIQHKVSQNGYSYIIEFGKNWGGINLGLLSFCGTYSNSDFYKDFFQYVRRHEYGHSFQNIMFGPLQIFIVGIPSVIRYIYYTYKLHQGIDLGDKWYQSAWFEHQATTIGYKKIGE